MTHKPADDSFPIDRSDVETLEACLVCEGRSMQDVAEVETAAGVCFLTTSACGECGHVFRRCRPSSEWFRRMWALRQSRQGGQTPFNPEIESRRYHRYFATAEVLRRHGCGPQVIDVGCGPASGLKAFADAGFQPVGLEPDRTRARFVEVPGVTIIETTVEAYAARPRQLFDVVTCQHSLEHFHRPADVMRALAALVPDGGFLFVEVPDFRHSVHDWNDVLYLAHLSNFSAESLRRLASTAGLSVVERTFPPSDGPGKAHLAYLFQKSASCDLPVDVSPTFVREVCSVYRHGLLADVPNLPPLELLRFVIPRVNDLSLGFKGNPQSVRADVHDNFAGREISFDDDAGTFRVE